MARPGAQAKSCRTLGAAQSTLPPGAAIARWPANWVRIEVISCEAWARLALKASKCLGSACASRCDTPATPRRNPPVIDKKHRQPAESRARSLQLVQQPRLQIGAVPAAGWSVAQLQVPPDPRLKLRLGGGLGEALCCACISRWTVAVALPLPKHLARCRPPGRLREWKRPMRLLVRLPFRLPWRLWGSLRASSSGDSLMSPPFGELPPVRLRLDDDPWLSPSGTRCSCSLAHLLRGSLLA